MKCRRRPCPPLSPRQPRQTASDDPLWGDSLHLSHSVIKPTIRFQGTEWPSQRKGFSLRWRGTQSYSDGSGRQSSFVSVTVLLRKYERAGVLSPIAAWFRAREEVELTPEPSGSAELWICEWGVEQGREACVAVRGVQRKPLLSFTPLRRTVQVLNGGLTTSLASVKCSA